MIAVFLKARAMSPLDNLKNREHNKNSRLRLTKLLHNGDGSIDRVECDEHGCR